MKASSKPGFTPSKETYSAGFTLLAILLHLLLKFASHFPALYADIPLFVALLIGGVPLVWVLLKKLVRRDFGSDLLAGVSILAAILLREYLVATIVVLMLSGGETLETFATGAGFVGARRIGQAHAEFGASQGCCRSGGYQTFRNSNW